MITATETRWAEAGPKRRLLLIDVVIRLVREKPMGVVGGVIVLAMLLAGILADVVAPYGYNEWILTDRLLPPSGQHILGTDHLGRDLLSRIIYGARISMIVGMAGTTISTLVAISIGIFSGYVGGKYDIVAQRMVDAFMCFPSIFLMLTVMVLVGPGILQVTIVLGVVWGIWYSRVVRGAVIGIKENMYVEAVEAVGCSTSRILLRHILPNIMAPVIIIFTITIGQIILAEATLSFLGYGIPPPQPSWGGMLSGEGRRFMTQSHWMVLWPGLALSIVVWGINMLGDAVRDVLDPRLRGRLGRYGGPKRREKLEKGSKS